MLLYISGGMGKYSIPDSHIRSALMIEVEMYVWKTRTTTHIGPWYVGNDSRTRKMILLSKHCVDVGLGRIGKAFYEGKKFQTTRISIQESPSSCYKYKEARPAQAIDEIPVNNCDNARKTSPSQYHIDISINLQPPPHPRPHPHSFHHFHSHSHCPQPSPSK
jgi:hypothetical protein